VIYNVRLLVLFLGIASAFFLVLGMIRPWAMLWWEDVQNRKKVLYVYGFLTLLFFIAYYVLKFVK
jgi:hypothetical protein